MIRRKTTLPEYLSRLNPTQLAIAKSHLLNIFRVNPWLSRFCADSLQIIASNSNQINTLPTRSEKNFNLDPKGSKPMPLNQNIRVCTHIKVNGVPCGSPALRGEIFCYFHQRMIRGVRTPPKSRLHPIANFEDAQAIQASLMEVVNALVRNHIDVARARLILRALSIASRNANKVRFDCWQSEMVKEVPEYPAAPPAASQFATARAQAAALATISAPQEEESEQERVASAFHPASANVRRRKRPASVKTTARARAASRSRTG
jgi:hypothetical protein